MWNTYEVPGDIRCQIKHLLYQHKDTPTRCRFNCYSFCMYLFYMDSFYILLFGSTTAKLTVNVLSYILYFAITNLSCCYTYYGLKDGKDVVWWKKWGLGPSYCGLCMFVGWLLFCVIGTSFKPIPFDAICPAPKLSLNETTSNVSSIQ